MIAESRTANEPRNLSLFTTFARARGLIKETESIPYHTIVTGSIELLDKQRDFLAIKPDKWTALWELMKPIPLVGSEHGYEVMNSQQLINLSRRPETAWASLQTRFRAIIYLFRQSDNVPSEVELADWLRSSFLLFMELLQVDYEIRKAWARWFDPSRLQPPDSDVDLEQFDESPYPPYLGDLFVARGSKIDSIVYKYARGVGVSKDDVDFVLDGVTLLSVQSLDKELGSVKSEKLNTAGEPMKPTPTRLDKPQSSAM